MTDAKRTIAKISLKRPHQWDAVGSAGDIADSTVFKCRVCGIHATANGRLDDKEYPSCKYVTKAPKGIQHEPISSKSPGIEPPLRAVYKRRVSFVQDIVMCENCPCHRMHDERATCGVTAEPITGSGDIPKTCPLRSGDVVLRGPQ